MELAALRTARFLDIYEKLVPSVEEVSEYFFLNVTKLFSFQEMQTWLDNKLGDFVLAVRYLIRSHLLIST